MSDDGLPCILYGQLYTTYLSEEIESVLSRTKVSDPAIERSNDGDVIIPCSGETPEDIATARCIRIKGILYGGDLNVLKPRQHDGVFLAFQLNGRRRMDIAKIAVGKTIVHLHAPDLKHLRIWFPKSRLEEERIARFLSLINRRIELQNKIIEDLKRLKKRIADSLVRIIPNAFLRVQMRDILNERSERNQSNYPVFSVAVEAGVVDQIQHLGRSFAAKETSHYRVAYYGDVVYTKSPTGAYPFGIIKQSQNNAPVALSPLYGVYSPSSFEIGYFLHCFFLNETNANNYLHPLVDRGAKNTMNITNQRFLDGCVPVPKTSALQAIYGLLASIENKLALNLKIRNAYQSQKTFLLKNLFI